MELKDHAGKYLLFGIVLIISGIVAVNYDNEQNGGVATAFFVFSTLVIMFGVLLTFSSGMALYDSQEIPYDSIPDLPKLSLKENQKWRPETNFRYLEEFKKSYFQSEKTFYESLKSINNEHKHLHNADGFIIFSRSLKNFHSHQRSLEYNYEICSELEKKIERIFAGDVRTDLRELEEDLEKSELKIRQNREDIQEEEKYLASLSEEERKNKGGSLFNSFRKQENKSLEIRMVKLRSRIKELKEFDHTKLYSELGVSAEAMRLEQKGLAEIKDKTDLVNQINPRQKPKTPEELKQERINRLNQDKRKFEMEREKIISDKDLLKEEKIRKLNFLDEKLSEIQQDIYDNL